LSFTGDNAANLQLEGALPMVPREGSFIISMMGFRPPAQYGRAIK
jgi:hypothetical protein